MYKMGLSDVDKLEWYMTKIGKPYKPGNVAVANNLEDDNSPVKKGSFSQFI